MVELRESRIGRVDVHNRCARLRLDVSCVYRDRVVLLAAPAPAPYVSVSVCPRGAAS